MIVRIFLVFILSAQSFAKAKAEQMVSLPAGAYMSFILKSESKRGVKSEFIREPISVKSFYLDRQVVTNSDFLRFVKRHPEWQKSKIPSVFADRHYLNGWKADLNFGSPRNNSRPVINVSWFVAKAYCESQRKTLPTTDQWEYALDDRGRNRSSVKERILAWYSEPNRHEVAAARADSRNGFGVQDMIGVVWEWTLDFNSFLAGEELRDSNQKDSALFCGGGSLGKLSANDYAAFMRYSFRASLKANYTTENLGFRCASEDK